MNLDIRIDKGKIFAPLKDKWLLDKPEERVRQQYVCRLVNSYGYSLTQMSQEVKVNNSLRGQGRAMADIVIWRDEKEKMQSKSPIVVIECKAEYISIHEEDYFQGYNYASWAGADFFVTTNLKETRIFKVVKGVLPKKLEEVVNIPTAEDVKDSKKIGALLKQTKAFTRDEFSKLLFKCHNIIRNNDKLSPEAAFDEISKILFIKIRYERTNSENQIFSLEEFKKAKAYDDLYRAASDLPFYQKLFELTKKDFKDDDLFDENETIRIRENSFEAIVKELEIYNLSNTSDDIKGIAFEQFLGRTFRGELGQFFTPRTVVDFMVDVLDPQEGEVVCDPCCGSGGFLIKTFEYVRSKIEEDIQLKKEEIKKTFYDSEYDSLPDTEKSFVDEKVVKLFNVLNEELNINNPESRLRQLSYDCIFGTDANPRMSRTAKMNMIMHGDGHGGVHHNDGLLNVNGIFENRFDIIFTNPPFGSRVEKSLKISEADKYKDIKRIEKYMERYGNAYDDALKQVNNNVGKSILSLYRTGSMSSLTEVLFIERCLNLLKPGGRMGIVLTEGVLNNPKLQKIRDFVESKAKIILITSIPQDVFIRSGAVVKPSLLFFKKFTSEEKKQYEDIRKNAEKKVHKKYEGEIRELKDKIACKLDVLNTIEKRKSYKSELKDLENKILLEVRSEIKLAFNYYIPIAEVEKAGISSTGAKIENELEPLAIEYKAYSVKNKLWEIKEHKISYEIIGDDIHRIIKGVF